MLCASETCTLHSLHDAARVCKVSTQKSLEFLCYLHANKCQLLDGEGCILDPYMAFVILVPLPKGYEASSEGTDIAVA